MKRYIIFLFLSYCAICYSQIDDLSRQKDIFFQDEFSFGLFFKTNGWGLDYRRGYFVNLNQKNLMEINFNRIKHPKEYKQESYYKLFSKYVYGKLNEVYDFNIGLGRQFTIVDKREPGTIEMQIIAMIGTQIALLKPIYYEIIVSSSPSYETTYEKYKPAHQPGLIMGKASYILGFNEISINYGFYIKIGTSFEHSKKIKSLNSFEAGIKFDYFIKTLTIMAETPNYKFVPSLYISYRIGKIIKTSNRKEKDKQIN